MLVTQSIFAQIKFDGDFESGNLKSVFTNDSTTFYVETFDETEATNFRYLGGRWFYFRISGVKDKFIRVEITTPPSDFTRAIYSYDNVNFERFSFDESPERGVFQKTFEKDTVYAAYYTPYTFSMLQQKLALWEKSQFVKLDTLGYSPNLFPMQEMIITDFTVPDDEKQTIWIHSRTHPGETPSSWHFEGIVNELLSGSEVVNHYLTKLKFHLIPFVNPDGVYFGNSRTNPSFIDLERQWDKETNQTSQEVVILKSRLKELCDEKPVSVFLNLHSQAASYCTFWIHRARSTSQNFYRSQYQFKYLHVSDNPYFVPADSSESDLQSYFPEGWLWNNYGEDVMALTYETPYNNYFKSSNEPYIEVTNENLFEIGRRTVYAIAEYLEISHPYHFIMDNKMARYAGDQPTTYAVTNEYFGEDFDVLESDKTIFAVFESEELPSGIYDVSGWWPTSEVNSFETVFSIITPDSTHEITKTQKANGRQWNYLTSVELKQRGRIAVKLQSNSTGLVVADAFRLVHSGSITSVDKEILPAEFVLHQNYPNPFNPSTTIRYSINNSTRDKHVSLIVFDILGRVVSTLVNGYQFPGEYELTFNASDFGTKLTSGPYFYRLKVGDQMQIKKMILVK